MPNRIHQSNFHMWKQDEVTQAIFAALQKLRDEINQSLTNADVILGDKAEINVPRLIGTREGLDLILQISYDDIEESEDESESTVRP